LVLGYFATPPACLPCFCFFATLLRKPKAIKQSNSLLAALAKLVRRRRWQQGMQLCEGDKTKAKKAKPTALGLV
jgi:hypothetical protein